MGPPFRYVDDAGRAWDVYDFKTVQGRKRRVPLNHSDAEARAFVAVDDGTVLVYRFGCIAYRCTEPKLVEGQLHFAKPLHANAAERVAGA
jgi:hypothetical protein